MVNLSGVSKGNIPPPPDAPPPSAAMARIAAQNHQNHTATQQKPLPPSAPVLPAVAKIVDQGQPTPVTVHNTPPVAIAAPTSNSNAPSPMTIPVPMTSGTLASSVHIPPSAHHQSQVLNQQPSPTIDHQHQLVPMMTPYTLPTYPPATAPSLYIPTPHYNIPQSGMSQTIMS